MLYLWGLKPRLGLVHLNLNFDCDWLIQSTTLNVIDLLHCPMTTWCFFKPITIEKIVIFVLTITLPFMHNNRHFRVLGNFDKNFIRTFSLGSLAKYISFT